LRVHPVRVLLDLVPLLLVERRKVPGPRHPAAGLSLADRQPPRGYGRAARQPRGPVQALPLPHHHELLQDLPQGAQPGKGDRRDQEDDARAKGGLMKRVLAVPAMLLAVAASALAGEGYDYDALTREALRGV